MTDHLGNVRATVNRIKQTNGEAKVEDYTDYYPFGSMMPGRSQVSSYKYRYDYQGQYSEKDKEFSTAGMNFFELRSWDGRIGRWNTTDVYGQYHSPYLGMGNNPVVGVDPDGGNVLNWISQNWNWRGAVSGAVIGLGVTALTTGQIPRNHCNKRFDTSNSLKDRQPPRLGLSWSLPAGRQQQEESEEVSLAPNSY